LYVLWCEVASEKRNWEREGPGPAQPSHAHACWWAGLGAGLVLLAPPPPLDVWVPTNVGVFSPLPPSPSLVLRCPQSKADQTLDLVSPPRSESHGFVVVVVLQPEPAARVRLPLQAASYRRLRRRQEQSPPTLHRRLLRGPLPHHRC